MTLGDPQICTRIVGDSEQNKVSHVFTPSHGANRFGQKLDFVDVCIDSDRWKEWLNKFRRMPVKVFPSFPAYPRKTAMGGSVARKHNATSVSVGK